MSRAKRPRITWVSCVALALTAMSADKAGTQQIDFSPERWDLQAALIEEHLGRPALKGTTFLKGVSFDNGVIEVDVAMTGARSYPGIVFRMEDATNYERVYIRPHRSGRVPPSLYSDVLQYVPAFNGIDSWQLYSGNGFTAPAVIPVEQWMHVRLEVKGTQARLFVGGAEKPALVIPELMHGASRGGIGLVGPMDGSAYFSNFAFRPDTTLHFDPPRLGDISPGIIRDWQLSRPFGALHVDLERTPEQQGLTDLDWQPVSADSRGLVDISHFHPRGTEPDVAFARTVLHADEDRTFKLDFGYSDVVGIFLNGRLLFAGNSSYMSRDPSFLGIIGFFDAAELQLNRGDNELLLAVAEGFGGWGFMARDGEAIFQTDGMAQLWESAKELSIPESAVYDPASRAIYVSNYDGYNRSGPEGLQFISKLSKDGRIDALEWVRGLKNPTGLVVSKGRLFAVEPTSLVEIDIAGARILKRHGVAGAIALNDIAADTDGVLYVSDSRKGAIFRFTGDKTEEWLIGSEISQPNGVWVERGKLFWGNNGDGTLKSADLTTKQIQTVGRFGQGVIDGVVGDREGNLFVSHNEGRLYRVASTGGVTKLLDTSVPGIPIADFTIIPEMRLFVIPNFTKGSVTAWKYE
jgi:sugar lactone lactonase YvrE